MKVKNDKILIQIACVCIAIVLWANVIIEENPKMENTITTIPISVKNISALEQSNMVFMDDIDDFTVNVRISGYREELLKISKKDITATIDLLGNFTEGTNKIQVDVNVPGNVELIDYSPKYLTCKIESVISKTLDVQVKYTGNQALGYEAIYGAANPSTVIVKGPRSVVNSATEAVAEVNVEAAESTIVKNVPIRIFSDTGSELSLDLSHSVVEATIPVYPFKFVPIKPTYVGVPLEGYKVVNISAEPDKIKIAAPQEILDKITEVQTEPLDITESYYNVSAAKKILNDGSFYILDNSSTPTIKATIERIIQKDFVYTFDDLQFINIPEGTNVKKPDEDTTFIVTVDGVTSVINQFTKDDVKLVVDLTGAVVGANELNIDIQTETELEKKSINHQTVSFELIEETDNSTTDGTVNE